MDFKSTILLFALLACSCAFPPSNHRHTLQSRNSVDIYHPRLGIYGGTKTTIEQHPYLVGILFDGIFLCAGTIINNKWVITVSGCVAGIEPKDITVVAASDDGVNGILHTVKRVVVHPNYGMTPYDYEFACIELQNPLKFTDKTKNVKIANQAPKEGSWVQAAGWGLTDSALDEKDYSRTELEQGGLIWMKKDYCETTFSAVDFKWTERMACVLNRNKTTLCLNDWGDGFVQNGALHGMFVAVYPYGSCSDQAGPLLLADISVAADWVKGVTKLKVY